MSSTRNVDRVTMSAEDAPKPEVIKQEEEYLRKVHPTPEDVPGCMKLFDDFLMCNGTVLAPNPWVTTAC